MAVRLGVRHRDAADHARAAAAIVDEHRLASELPTDCAISRAVRSTGPPAG